MFNPTPRRDLDLPEPESQPSPPAGTKAVWNLPAAVAGWLVPGLGHVLAGHTRRGVVLFLCIGGLWVSGLLIGGVSVLQSRGANGALRPWYLGQAVIAPTLAVEYLHDRYRSQSGGREPMPGDALVPYQPAYGRAFELGTLYSSLAGLLNLLAVIDIAYREPRSTEHKLPLGAG